MSLFPATGRANAAVASPIGAGGGAPPGPPPAPPRPKAR